MIITGVCHQVNRSVILLSESSGECTPYKIFIFNSAGELGSSVKELPDKTLPQ